MSLRTWQLRQRAGIYRIREGFLVVVSNSRLDIRTLWNVPLIPP
jgi:hypothetical protein